ncbi:MAG TPA: tRNA guanosine(34) transglycosylase Tgt [Solirubrobacteraceae bacterium]|nr:tRNA guanosine(34) transglycosylase Tgt [Solirubrobacteraceae bacterium]
MPALRIIARDEATRARAGVLATPHGEIHTPAFVPLATRASVRTLAPGQVAALGYELVLGNTFHLFLAPGGELIERFGGLHRFMGWERAIISDSGGFQVFSMGHGTVADEIKGRRGVAGEGAILAIEEEGVRFRSYIDGSQRFLSPEISMAVQAQLRSDIVLAFDECTPFHVERDYTERSTERTHRWLQRCLRWRAEHAGEPAVPANGGSLFYGIVQGGVYEDLRVASTAAICASGCDGVAIGGSLGQDKAQMHEVVGWSTRELERLAPERPRHLLGIGEVDDLIRGVELGIDSFDCAMPTRLARHGTALVPDPTNRWRLALDRPACRLDERPLIDGCPCPACAGGLSRGYLYHLARSGEQTGGHLLTLHNLTFIAALMTRLRTAILDGRLAAEAAALRAGG